MILMQWYQIVKQQTLSKSQSYKDASGSTKSGFVNQTISIANLMRTIRSGSYNEGVVFGTGNVEPTINDYTLSGEIVGNISGSVSTEIIDNETIKAIYAVTNNGSDSVTIGEIGICFKADSYGYGNGGGFAMFDRTVLETPITIEPGGIGQITHLITMKTPTS